MSDADRRIGNAVLCCLLLEPDLVQRAEDIGLQERHFCYFPHQLIFRSIHSLWSRKTPADFIAVEHDLNERGVLLDAGGTDGLMKLFDAIPSSAGFDRYIDLLFRQHEEWTKKVNLQTALKLIDEGNTLGADYLLQQALDVARMRKVHREPLPIERFGDVDVDLSVNQLVDGWLDRGAVSMIFGPSGAGKSFLALDLAFCVATGRPWAGAKSVCQGSVLYVATESPRSMRLRIKALRAVYPGIDAKNVPIGLVPVVPDLVNSDDDADRVVETVIHAAKTFGAPVALIVIDTLAHTLSGSDENSFLAMGAAATRLVKIRNATNATVLIVHHSGKDESKGARGHSSLKGAMDNQIEVSREDVVRTARVVKARDGEEGESVNFQLDPVEVGQDGQGRSVKVPTVTYLTGDREIPDPPGRLGDVLRALRGACKARESGWATEEEWFTSFEIEAPELSKAALSREFRRSTARLFPTFSVKGVDRGKTAYKPRVFGQAAGQVRTAPEAHRSSPVNGRSTAVDQAPETRSGQAGQTPIGLTALTATVANLTETQDEAEARARIESLRPRTE